MRNLKWLSFKEAIIPTLDECPALVSLYGLYQESADKFIIDHYSACVLIEKRVQFPYKDTITAELPDSFTCRAELPEELSSSSYQLVRLNGMVRYLFCLFVKNSNVTFFIKFFL